MMKLLSLAVFAVAVATISSQSAIRGLPGSECASDKHCTADNSVCYRQNPCWLGTCYCKRGFSLSQNTTEDIGDCVENNKLGGTCGWMQGGCVGNLKCVYPASATAYTLGICSCPYGTTADGDKWCTGSAELHGVCGTQTPTPDDYSHWACKAYNEYYKDDPELKAEVGFLPQTCQLDGLNGDYRCVCTANYEKDSSNTTCPRRQFASYGGDCSTLGCDPEIMGMSCDLAATPDECVCATDLSPRSYNGEDGATKQGCAHANAIFEVEEGHDCDDSDPDPAKHKYCAQPLTCGTCPEDGGLGVSLCMNGAAEMAVSLAVLGISLLSTKFL